MKRTAFGKAAISSLLVATTMVGCSGAAFRPSAAAVKSNSEATRFAASAEKALGARDGAAAVTAAEAAVRAAPDNAAYRQILGRAYIANGRFSSAETALSDAMALGNADPRTIVSLALVQVGLGKSEAAHTLLSANTDKVPVTDYGLAIAMAGDAPEGVRILSEAIHDPSANARTRQNLAYAYALAGRWKDARVMAGEDLDPLVANHRVAQWAMTSDPALASQRVATLMGVTINAADGGLPTALALGAPAVPVALADAASAIPVSSPVEATSAGWVETVAVDTAPQSTMIETAPVIKAPETLVRSAAVTQAKPVFAAAKLKAASAIVVPAPVARMQQVAFIKPAATGASNWVVQLGAYDTAAVAKDKWMGMARGNSMLATFPVLTSQATVKGKPYHRLAISGFANRADAKMLCHSIQSQRGQCFVRAGTQDATTQRWAVATPKARQFASR